MAKEPNDPDREIVCTCMQVTRGRILQAIAAGAASLDDLSEATGCCTGCGGCRPDVEAILAEERP